MNNDALWRLPPTGLERAIDGEHPAVVIRDIASRPRTKGHVIVFANEKGGAGKSTLAFHSAIALASLGWKVAAIDLDHGQQTLSRALTNREASGRRLGVALPTPNHVTLANPGGAVLLQEIARIGSKCQYVVIDIAGQDSPSARRCIAMADTLVTPVNSSFADLDVLGQFDALTMSLKRYGNFALRVDALRQARLKSGLSPLDWVVVPNRVRRTSSRNEFRFNTALALLARELGFRLGEGLGDRVAYRELFLYGLTLLDLKKIPQLANVNVSARREIEQLIAGYQLPCWADRAPVPGQTRLVSERTPAPAVRQLVSAR